MKKNRTYGLMEDIGLLKMIKIMRLAIFILFLSLSQVFAVDSYSQQTKLSLDLKNAKVEDVLDKIEKSSEFYFMYNKGMVDVERKIDIQVEGKGINQILDKVFENTGISYSIKDRQILLINNSMVKYGAESNAQQQKSISGKVTDSSGASLPGVSVVIKGTTTGVITDMDGKYTLAKVPENATLVFSFVGMKTQEVKVGTQNSINVVLAEEAIGLEEVVAVGYGTQKRAELTGAISSIDGNSMARTNSLSVNGALQGRAAGITVTSASGQPGGAVTVRIRGGGNMNSSDPLYVVDGQIMGGGPAVVFAQSGLAKSNDTDNPLSNINPKDIESIRILKDAASTAIYGTRAANGVILITTKSGSTLGKPKMSYSGTVGFSNTTNRLKFLDSKDFMERMNTQYVNAGLPPIYSDITTALQTVGNTNWGDEILRTGILHDHTITLQGGTDLFNYYTSSNYNHSEGTVIGTNFERLNFRFNSNAKISNKINIGNRLNVSSKKTKAMQDPLGSIGFSDSRENTASSFIQLSLIRPPVFKVKHEDGSWAGTDNASLDLRPNPVALVDRANQYNKQLQVNGSLFVEYEPVKNLKIKTMGSLEFSNSDYYGFMPLFKEDIFLQEISQVAMLKNTSSIWTWDNTANYRIALGNHIFSFLTGISATQANSSSLTGSSGWDDNDFKLVADNAKVRSFNSDMDKWSLYSLFGRFNYNFKDKYLLTANLRRDGSSKFGSNYKFGIFPSVSAGWWISEEKFFPQIPLISRLKLRGGFGKVGSDAIPTFQYLPLLRSDYGYPFDNAKSSQGLMLAGVANPNLRWETTSDANLGFDMMMLNDHLSVTAEFYQKKQSDVLLAVPLPPTSGFTSALSNTGSSETKGFDLSMEYNNSTGKLNYSFNMNISHYKSTVKELGVGQDQIFVFQSASGEYAAVMKPGEVLGAFYGFVSEGIFQTQEEINIANKLGDPLVPYQSPQTSPGDFKYKDLNNDGVINSKDRTIIGNPHPDLVVSLGGNFSYKQFDLSFMLYSSIGNDIYNLSYAQYTQSGGGVNKVSDVKNAWHGAGTSNSIPRAVQTDPNQNSRYASHLIENGTYLRLRDLQIGYTLPESVTGNVFKNARAFISGQNLLTFTKYKGFDPEIGAYRGVSAATGIDQATYPNVRSLNLGITVNF